MMMRTNDSGKRALCLGLASVIMLLACFVLGAGPAEAETDGFTYEVMEDGNASITACSLTGDIEIPSTIDGYTVTKLGQKLFYGSFGVTSVSVPATVTQLGNNENLQFAYVFSYFSREDALDSNSERSSTMDWLFPPSPMNISMNA